MGRWAGAPGLVDHTDRDVKPTTPQARRACRDRHPHPRTPPAQSRPPRSCLQWLLVDPPVRMRQCPQSRPPTPARSATLPNRLAAARIHRETRDDGGLRLLLGKPEAEDEAQGFPGCSHSHTQPLAAGHTSDSVIGHQRHRIY